MNPVNVNVVQVSEDTGVRDQYSVKRESGTGVCACVIGDLNAADERAAGRVSELKGAWPERSSAGT